MKESKIGYSLFLPFLVSAVGVLALLLVSLIPERAVLPHAEESAHQLLDKGEFALDNQRPAYAMDYNSDAVILMESLTLRPDTVLLNPMLWQGDALQRDAFLAVCQGEPCNTYYVRYWMGFRLLIKPLLVFFSYDTICWLLSLGFFLAAGSAVSLLAARHGLRPALSLAAAITLVNPAVIAHSPQFFTCFFLAFFSVFLSESRTGRQHLSLLFCGIGALTQFFDFYTAPVLTLGIPLLVCVESGQLGEKTLRSAMKLSLLWLYGYGSMWLVKLCLTSVFTSVDGFENGFRSMAFRLGLTGRGVRAEHYRLGAALKLVWETVFPGGLSLPALILSLAVIGFICMALARIHDPSFRVVVVVELMIACFPLFWFCVAVQPTSIHYWFQYRGICVFFFGLLLAFGRVLVRLRQAYRKKT